MPMPIAARAASATCRARSGSPSMNREVSHLAPGAGVMLAVEMETKNSTARVYAVITYSYRHLECSTRIPMATACAPARTAVYRRRRPERTVLYRTVQTHLATWLESPVTVGRALRVRRMSSGSSAAISTAGFSRMALPALDAPSAVTIFSSPGHAKVVVSVPLATPGEWSKPPPLWPTPILPRLPVRQWVLSVPKRLRDPLEHDPAIETLALRISRDWRLASTSKSGAAGCRGRSSSRNASHLCRRNSSWPGWSPTTTREHSTPWRVRRSRSCWRDCCIRRRLGRPGWLRAGMRGGRPSPAGCGRRAMSHWCEIARRLEALSDTLTASTC
jgi:hypothetical protein